MNNIKKLDWAPFNRRIWQRNYWEHIIRNEQDLNKISQYIQLNPTMWDRDPLGSAIYCDPFYMSCDMVPGKV